MEIEHWDMYQVKCNGFFFLCLHKSSSNLPVPAPATGAMSTGEANRASNEPNAATNLCPAHSALHTKVI